MQEPNITVFGAPGCPDCRRSKQFLGEQRIPFVGEHRPGRGRQNAGPGSQRR